MLVKVSIENFKSFDRATAVSYTHLFFVFWCDCTV